MTRKYQSNAVSKLPPADSDSDVLYLSPDRVLKNNERAEELDQSNSARLPDPDRENWLGSGTLSRQLKESLSGLAKLVTNVTEAYTCVILVRPSAEKKLIVGGAQTLSREFKFNAEVPFGAGLIGWTAENGARISVSPFERDARTLMIYEKDQGLKSFVAAPILDSCGAVIGVVACDSKKSYAFAKLTEKLLYDFAEQASQLVELESRLSQAMEIKPSDPNSELLNALEELRQCDEEETLLNMVAHLPTTLIERDALVVMAVNQSGVGQGVFYSASTNQIENRLLELVCNHNKVICSDRSIQAKTRDDSKQRSFLSVPFHVLGKDAGSLNLLSKPYQAFTAPQIGLLERIASTIGRELERIRLRDKYRDSSDSGEILSWKHFAIKANLHLKEAAKQRQKLALVRISVTNLKELETVAGIDASLAAVRKVFRFVDQLKRQGSVTCYLFGNQMLLLTDHASAKRTATRLQALLAKVKPEDLISSRELEGLKLGAMLSRGTKIAIARFPEDGETLQDLCSNSLQQLSDEQPTELSGGTPNAGKWI